MSTCPACQSPLETRFVMQAEMHCCNRCGGMFLDMATGSLIRVDFHEAFTQFAQSVGASSRRCPVHGEQMRIVSVMCAAGIVEIHRSACCTGVFLEAGQSSLLSAPRGAHAHPRHPAVSPAEPTPAPPRHVPGPRFGSAAPPPMPGSVAVATGFGPPNAFDAPTRPSAPHAPAPPQQHRTSSPDYRPAAQSFGISARGAGVVASCPSCNVALGHDQMNGVDVDACTGCGFVFFEKGEPERAGIDTEALFADGAWAAPRGNGPELRCVMGHEGSMLHFRPSSIAGEFDVHFAICCHGVWVAASEVPKLRAAARKACYDRAEIQHAAGVRVQHSRAEQTPEERRHAEFVQVAGGIISGAVGRAEDHLEEANERRRRMIDGALHGRRRGGLLDYDD